MEIEVNLISFLQYNRRYTYRYFQSTRTFKCGEKYQSSALAADALHFSSDVLSSIVVIAD